MTARATNVHKYLSSSYIGAFFRSIFVSVLGINPGKPLIQASANSTNIDDRMSESVLPQREIAGLELFKTPTREAEKARAGIFFARTLPFAHSFRYYPRR